MTNPSVDDWRCRDGCRIVLPTAQQQNATNVCLQSNKLGCGKRSSPHAGARSATDEWLKGLEGR